MASKLTLFVRNALISAVRSPGAATRALTVRSLCTAPPAPDDKAPTTGDAIGEDHSSPPEAPTEARDPFLDPFTPKTQDPVFAKLTGTGRYTLKTDIIHFLEGCNLGIEDIKVDYNRAYNPAGMILRFPSITALDSARRVISRKGGVFRLEKVDGAQWDLTEVYNGKAVVVQGIPQNAILEDIERLFYGCKFDASNMKIFSRNYPEVSKTAVVHFSSRPEAMHAIRTKNHNFCLNSQVQMYLLQ